MTSEKHTSWYIYGFQVLQHNVYFVNDCHSLSKTESKSGCALGCGLTVSAQCTQSLWEGGGARWWQSNCLRQDFKTRIYKSMGGITVNKSINPSFIDHTYFLENIKVLKIKSYAGLLITKVK